MVMQHRKKRDGCAVCTNIAPCPSCPKGYQCQQIFRSSCQDCPYNKCVAVAGSSSSSSGGSKALGGGLGAMLAIVALAAVAYVLWRRKTHQRRIALQTSAKQRQEKVDAHEDKQDTLQLGAVQEGDEDHFVISGSLADPTLSHRRSFGAATHLSRITEGCEEEEEEYCNGAQRGAKGRNSMLSAKSVPQSVTSGLGPRISIGSGTTFGSKNIIPIVFQPHTDSSAPSMPSAVHRATGAPVVQPMHSNGSGNKGPVRPVRAPDLNLRLPVPNAPTRSSPLAGNAVTASSTSASPASTNNYDFMSIDPVKSLSADRHLSTGTIGTMNSYNSASLSYVMSAPQIVTPSEGVRRIQIGKGGKAQLVRGDSLKRKNQGTSDSALDPFQDPLFAIVDEVDFEKESRDLLPPSKSQLFAGQQRASHSSAISTSTLGIPFSDNPFGPSRASADFLQHDPSPTDAVDRSSWLGQAFDAIEALERSDALERSRPSSAVPLEEETREELDEPGSNPFQDPPPAERASTISGTSLLSQFAFNLPPPVPSK